MQPITLEQLITLNREISALAAAGMPLADGLVRVADDFSGPTASLARRLAERMSQGKDLIAAFDDEGDAIPHSYRALVRAGWRSGRLTSALEGYTQTAVRMSELRRLIGVSLLYPLFLIVLIWFLFLFATNYFLPRFDWLEINDQFWVQPFRFLTFSSYGLGTWLITILVPLVFVGFAYLLWRRTRVARDPGTNGLKSWLDFFPGLSRVRRLSSMASFADLLRLFVEQRIPLPEALPLAANASSLQDSVATSQELTAELSEGKPISSNAHALRNLPPLVRLALLSNRQPEALAAKLQGVASSYHERAENLSRDLALLLPIGITALIGGTSVGIYAFLLLQPYISTLRHLAGWH